MKIWQETSNLAKIGGGGGGGNYGHFTRRLVFIVDSNERSAAIHRTYCCASIVTLSTFITLMKARYIYIYIHTHTHTHEYIYINTKGRYFYLFIATMGT